MIRNIAGIMADEEPKTPLSPSGLYNSSYMYSDTNQDAILDSTDMLNNRSEFTFMFWIYGREDAFWGSWSTGTGGEVLPIFSWSIISSQINIEFKIRNTSGGHTVVNSVYNWPFEWTLFSVTGSLLSNSIKLYANGVLLNTATMSYPVSNDYLSYAFKRVNSSPHSLSQPLFYDRALSDAEVAEHYVYDDNTMSSGVLGFNAMTPAQKSGITYLASLTEDISIAGNEFTDKSGNGVTLSPQPTLTGQQIYVYTDASDLPSDVQIYPVNSATFNGSGTSYFQAVSDIFSDAIQYTIMARVYIPSTSGTGTVFAEQTSGNGTPRLLLERSSATIRVKARIGGSTRTLTCNEPMQIGWNRVSFVHDVFGGTYRAGCNGVYNDGITFPTGASLNSSIGFTPPSIGASVYSVVASPLFGSVSFVTGASNALLSDARIEGIFNTANDLATEANCFDSVDPTDLSMWWDVSQINGNADTLVDYVDGNNLTTTGAVSYQSLGLTALCPS